MTFDNEDEKEEIKHKFNEESRLVNVEDQDFLIGWRNVTLGEEWDDKSTSKEYEAELGTAHPHTLVSMVSDLYHQRMSLQNHIQYETTTTRPSKQRTYLYEVFGFNTRKPKRATRNASVQFAMFQEYRSTIDHNYRRVSNIQHVLQRYTKNQSIFSKNEQRHWDVFFYEKNIPQPRHPNGRVRFKVGYKPGKFKFRTPTRIRRVQEASFPFRFESIDENLK